MERPLSAAEILLQSLGVEKASEIDLEAVAWSVGVIGIKVRPLDGCEARIAGHAGRAIISVKQGVRETRQRFSICHELGHWHHHRGQLLYCKSEDMHQREIANAKEGAANRYASDMLLPPYLLRPRLEGCTKVDLAMVETIANEFRASFTATAIKLAQMVSTPTMIVCHNQHGRRWHVQGPKVPREWFPRSDLDTRSLAFHALFEKGREQRAPRKIKANAWFERFDAERYEIIEQSFRPEDSMVVTILSMPHLNLG